MRTNVAMQPPPIFMVLHFPMARGPKGLEPCHIWRNFPNLDSYAMRGVATPFFFSPFTPPAMPNRPIPVSFDSRVVSASSTTSLLPRANPMPAAMRRVDSSASIDVRCPLSSGVADLTDYFNQTETPYTAGAGSKLLSLDDQVCADDCCFSDKLSPCPGSSLFNLT